MAGKVKNSNAGSDVAGELCKLTREVERKFLVTAAPAWLPQCEGVQIEQGYLAVTDAVEVRLRRQSSETLLTVKGGHGEVREEIETRLDKTPFEQLWPQTKGQRLAKTRRLVPLDDGLIAEVDVFERDLEGLIVAEVEFGSESAARDFKPPAWIGEELTGNEDYSGQSLALNGPPAGTAKKRRSYRLKKKEAAPDGMRRIALGRVERAVERLAGGDPDAIHDARKDLKKLRAVLRLVRDRLGDDRYRTQNEHYRDAGRLLSAARDAEVKVQTLAALSERSGSELPAEPIASWRLMLKDERDELVDGAGAELSSQLKEAAKRIAAGREEIAAWPLEDDSWGLVEADLVRGYRRARRAMKRARSNQTAAEVHQWRKRTKDLWYHLRLLQGAWKPVMEGTADQAHELADLLGDHHDLEVLAQDLQTRETIGQREAIAKLIERRQRKLLKRAIKLGNRLFAEKPKAFRRRLKAYWLAWRRA